MRKFAIYFLTMFLSAISLWGQAQEKTVTGTVKDGSNVPLPGVTVKVKGTGRATQTDANGVFVIKVAKGETLLISHVGFNEYQVRLGDASTVNIILKASDATLGEVVVTAYGIKRNKRELSYQAPVVKGDEVADTRRENFLNALSGRVPGLTVTSTAGTPGASAQIILRGPVSISGNNQPLFVVDGVPTSNSTFNQEAFLVTPSNLAATPTSNGFANRGADYTNRIADLNPEDIESITILKGPEATALYGSDGASGAIVITTRKAASGKSKVYYDNSFALQNVYRFPDLQGTYSRGNNGIYDPTAYNTLTSYGFNMFGPKYPAGTKLYDNVHNFFKNGFSQQHNIGLEGGTADAAYRFSAGYIKQDGVVPNTSYQRMNLRLSGNAKLSEKISMNSSFAYVISDNKKASKGTGSYYTDLITWPLDSDVRNYLNADGSRKLLRNTSSGYTGEFDNPFWDVYKNPSQDKTDRVTGNVTVNYKPTSWLNFGAIVGLDHFITDGLYTTNPQSYYGASVNGLISTYTQNFRDLSASLTSTVTRTFAEKFKNTLTVGFFAENSKMTVNSQKGEQFFEPNFISINNTAPTTQAARIAVQNQRKSRFFGSYTLGYNNILFLNLAGSYEGVSTLTSAFFDKYPFFKYGAVSGSFVFSDLKAVKQLNWLSYGKLRASYATTGKAPGIPYVIDSRFVPSIYTGGGFALDVIGGNSKLKPEFSRNLELGGELQFLNNRLGIDVAYYEINSKDQIISNRLSYGTGFVIKYINGGLVVNKGVEIQLKAEPVRAKHFNWNTVINLDHNKGIVKKMPADLPAYYDSDTWLYGNLRSQVSKGSSISNLSGFRLLRNNAGQLIISPTTGLPVKDLNYYPVGDRNPDFKIGIINTFSFGESWGLSFNIDIRKGGDVFNGNEMSMVQNGVSKRTLDREQPRIIQGVLQDGLENTAHPTANNIVVIPYFRNDFYSSMYTESDFIESVNWLRLRDITLSYRLPNIIIKKQKIVKSLSLFATGTDLFIITNYTGLDPNVSGNNSSLGGVGGTGIDYGSIPTARSFSAGIKVLF